MNSGYFTRSAGQRRPGARQAPGAVGTEYSVLPIVAVRAHASIALLHESSQTTELVLQNSNLLSCQSVHGYGTRVLVLSLSSNCCAGSLTTGRTLSGRPAAVHRQRALQRPCPHAWLGLLGDPLARGWTWKTIVLLHEELLYYRQMSE